VADGIARNICRVAAESSRDRGTVSHSSRGEAGLRWTPCNVTPTLDGPNGIASLARLGATGCVVYVHGGRSPRLAEKRKPRLQEELAGRDEKDSASLGVLDLVMDGYGPLIEFCGWRLFPYSHFIAQGLA
jgi:hypothetical protein